MLVFLVILGAIGLAFLGILVVWSPGTTQAFLDETGKPLAGSLSEKIHVRINGLEQLKISGDSDMVGKREAAPVTAIAALPPVWLSRRDDILHRRGKVFPQRLLRDKLIANRCTGRIDREIGCLKMTVDGKYYMALIFRWSNSIFKRTF